MATAAETNAHRSRISDISLEPLKMLSPICGYSDAPFVSLEEAVKPLMTILPDVKTYARRAKLETPEKPANGLTRDESAAIRLYSMEGKSRQKSLYYALNDILRSVDRRELERWFLYLKLFLSGLARLPSGHCFVFRGVRMDLSEQYKRGKLIIWWAFSSCSTSIEALEHEEFLGRAGKRTLFTIDCHSGKDISKHSYFECEKEILLLAASQFEVMGSLKPASGLHMIQLKEVQPATQLLQSISLDCIMNTAHLCAFTEDEIQNTSIQSTNILEDQSNIEKQNKATKIKETSSVKLIQSNPCEPIPNEKLDTLKLDIQHYIDNDARWLANGVTIAGKYKSGDGHNQLCKPCGICLDDNQTAFIADTENHRILEWKPGAISGTIVAGGNGPGNRLDQLNKPTMVVLDQETDSFIICDCGNQRVIRWPRRKLANGEILIGNIQCCGLTIDDQNFLYVSDIGKDAVRRYRIGDNRGTIVAGGMGRGDHLNQLNWPTHICVDRHQSVYVSDTLNHRVIKWSKEAKQGIIVAGGRGEGNTSNKLSGPKGLFVDHNGTLYVVDGSNHRIMRWRNGASHGDVIAGGNCRGQQANQLADPEALSFDQDGNMYVVDWGNHRIQLFTLNE